MPGTAAEEREAVRLEVGQVGCLLGAEPDGPLLDGFVRRVLAQGGELVVPGKPGVPGRLRAWIGARMRDGRFDSEPGSVRLGSPLWTRAVSGSPPVEGRPGRPEAPGGATLMVDALETLGANATIADLQVLAGDLRRLSLEGRLPVLAWVDLDLLSPGALAAVHSVFDRTWIDGRPQDGSLPLTLARSGPAVTAVPEHVRVGGTEAFDELEDVFFTLDGQGRCTSVLGGGLSSVGFDAEALLGRSSAEIVGEGAAVVHEDALARVRVGERVVYEWEAHRLDGGSACFRTTLSAVEDAKGAVASILGVTRDVTRARRREEEHHLLSLAVEQSPVSVVIKDRRGRIVYANAHAARASGYAVEELLGQRPEIFRSGVQEGVDEEIRQTLLRGGEWRGTLANRKKDGSLFWESAAIAPVTGRAGEITHFLAVKEDVTERRSLEQQLHQAQRLEGVGRLAGGMAHDFNNMLTVIMGFASFLEELLEDEETAVAYAREIQKAAERSSSLARQLLVFSSPGTPELQRFEIDHLVRGLRRLLETFLGEHVRLELELTSGLEIEADPSRIEQVLVNLVVNAHDAMPNEGGLLQVRTRRRPAEDGRGDAEVLLEVEDNGTGMEPEIQARIFDPFYTTKETGKGTGLGLSTVKGIVTAAGGRIEVESEPGMGSIFRVVLPEASPVTGDGETRSAS